MNLKKSRNDRIHPWRQAPWFSAEERYKLKGENMIIITGCGRSGTSYTTALLQKCNFDIKHERIGELGTVNWYYGIQIPKKEDIWIHQVRHPLKVIASNHTFIPNTWKFLFNVLPINNNQSLLTRCCLYWLIWNTMVETKCIKTYRIENIKNEWNDILSILELPKIKFPDSIPTNKNSRKHLNLTWDQLYDNDPNITESIMTLSKKYGYDI